MILVDTNVFVRLCRQDDPDHSFARRAIQFLGPTGSRIIVPQIIFEFWVVATRPIKGNGLGLPRDRAIKWLSFMKRICRILPDPPNIVERWESLIHANKTMGKAAHDARLVAAAELHGVTSILTFNTAHFVRYGIDIIDPRKLPIS